MLKQRIIESEDTMKKMYLAISILGTVIPFTFFIPWIGKNGLDVNLFVSEWFTNQISQFFAADFIISWLCFLLFIVVDSRKHRIKFWWISVIGNFCIGLSFALAFYLFLREGRAKEKDS